MRGAIHNNAALLGVANDNLGCYNCSKQQARSRFTSAAPREGEKKTRICRYASAQWCKMIDISRYICIMQQIAKSDVLSDPQTSVPHATAVARLLISIFINPDGNFCRYIHFFSSGIFPVIM
jgi:hypothetical protein